MVTYTAEPKKEVNPQLMEEGEPSTPKEQSPTQIIGSVLDDLILEEEEKEQVDSLSAKEEEGEGSSTHY